MHGHPPFEPGLRLEEGGMGQREYSRRSNQRVNNIACSSGPGPEVGETGCASLT